MSDLGTQLAPVKDCGKRTYPNEPTAKKLAKRVNDSGKSRVQPYHCCRCHGWHLGQSDLYAQSRGARHRRQQIAVSGRGARE
jgi:hypothetical protein